MLGHGTDPNNFIEPDPIPPENLDEEQLEAWHEDMADSFDISFEEGRQVFERYFTSSFKDTARVISDNYQYFEFLSDVTEVYVLGHSLSDVDLPYFDLIAESVSDRATWIVTYYHPSEKQNHLTQLNEIGIHNPIFKKIEEL